MSEGELICHRCKGTGLLHLDPADIDRDCAQCEKPDQWESLHEDLADCKDELKSEHSWAQYYFQRSEALKIELKAAQKEIKRAHEESTELGWLYTQVRESRL